jgi:hypothetical protein
MASGMARTLPAAALAALALAAPAHAQFAPVPPPSTLPPEAAVLQYREAVPTGAGPVAPGATGGRSTPLSPAAAQALAAAGGADRPALERVATSSDFGAPPTAGPAGRVPAEPVAEPSRTPDPGASLGRSVAAAADTAAGSGGRPLVLLLAMALVGAAFVVGARRRPGATG